MRSRFPDIQYFLMVGVGAGVPSEEADIRLGDVVISQPQHNSGGVIQYDFGKTVEGGLQQPAGFQNAPPSELLQAMAKLRSNRIRSTSNMLLHLEALPSAEFSRNNAGPDVLFQASYDHAGGPTCKKCSQDMIISRSARSTEEVVVHYGIIASGNQVMRHALTRDKISASFGGVFCFEMEAAGLMNSFPCLVIRGICDYADSHKNKKWQPHAAGAAAACAKELLSFVPTSHRNYHPIRRTLFTVPFQRDPSFVGRRTTLDELRKRYDNASSYHRRVALVGLGGAG